MDFSNSKKKINKLVKPEALENYINNPKMQKKFQGFLDSNETELYSPEGLPAVCRKAWHEMAQRNKLYSTSAGEGICRHVIISKRPFQVDGKQLVISATTQRRFRDDFGIKINLCDYEDFEYYIDLYGVRNLLDITKSAIDEFKFSQQTQQETELKWITFLIEVKKRIWNHIKQSAGYKKFVEDDWNSVAETTNTIKQQLKIQAEYLYPKNNGKLYVSFDLKSANYNSLYHYAQDIFLTEDGRKTSTWGEFVSSFSSEYPATAHYLTLSKLFRQKIFWEFDHAKQSILWEYLIIEIAKKIDSNMYKNAHHITDEIVFEIDELNIPYFKDFAAKELDQDKYRIKFFRLRNVAKGKSWILRQYLDGENDIKCCNPTEYTIIWKHVHNIALERRDFKFRWNQDKQDWDYTDNNIEWLI